MYAITAFVDALQIDGWKDRKIGYTSQIDRQGERVRFYVKELAHMIVGAGKCEICRVGQQAEILGER